MVTALTKQAKLDISKQTFLNIHKAVEEHVYTDEV